MRRRGVRERFRPLALVGAGGAVGAALRHGVAAALPSAVLGTLAVNVAGSFALGLLLAAAARSDRLSTEARLFVATGVLSSFTTYSTFALQTAQSPARLAVANVVATYGLGFLAAALGGWLGRERR